jgi:cleavage stimulation factor subunit 3
MYSDLAASQKMEKRLLEAYPAGKSHQALFPTPFNGPSPDAPLKRFAARFTYNGIDEIASRDLGFGTSSIVQQPPPLPRLDSQSVAIKRTHPESPRQSPRIPEARFRNGRDDRAGPMGGGRMEEPRAKRAKQSSPPRREAARNNRREMSPPMREQRPPLPVAPVGPEMDRSGLPKSVVWFLGNLPRPDLFDGM